ncbi:MAG TPA: hypothetical protein PKI32_07405 [Opitutales bacterium]|nr:hypothetical protein [Opitutales bacterium]
MSSEFRTAFASLACWLAPIAGASAGSFVATGIPNSQKQVLFDSGTRPVQVQKVAPPVVAAVPGTFPKPPQKLPGEIMFEWVGKVGRYWIDTLFFLDGGASDVDFHGRRRACIPEVGLVPQRFGAAPVFDRRRAFGLADYDRMQAEARAAELARAEAARQTAAQEEAARQAAAASNPASAPDAPDASRSGEAGESSNPGPGRVVSATSSATTQIDPASLLRYFDERNSTDDARIGVRFLLPYQSEPPLKMESGATYSESGSDNGGK